jgi:hypothetical protein
MSLTHYNLLLRYPHFNSFFLVCTSSSNSFLLRRRSVSLTILVI